MSLAAPLGYLTQPGRDLGRAILPFIAQGSEERERGRRQSSILLLHKTRALVLHQRNVTWASMRIFLERRAFDLTAEAPPLGHPFSLSARARWNICIDT
ncbi:unnamed protein product [Clonostachys solani]|uniref:Uncharacterized protein n=1 Tax=Clonostachys solani TaxID=160281 RepID=A0A9N9Z3P2_9HYPO|nr:unnamed protein product [Clonostachys solani]